MSEEFETTVDDVNGNLADLIQHNYSGRHLLERLLIRLIPFVNQTVTLEFRTLRPKPGDTIRFTAEIVEDDSE
ncbi:hypothetical protein G3I44_14420 [Halogeometricum borinquense]|uniref:Uncharacterized protein n=1 Tax=Halogeometricum borinquense TaxID=60847 RepID=A0A6C0ULY6_9EURY|nr:hypothetical protein [Halogeometricum borinquense]QIB75381.1 hypothetical protein G3I44_14420 [Halogeometricum borinquense]